MRQCEAMAFLFQIEKGGGKEQNAWVAVELEEWNGAFGDDVVKVFWLFPAGRGRVVEDECFL